MFFKQQLSLVLLLVPFAAPAAADYVVLKNGQKLRGEVVKQTATQLILKMPSLAVTVPQDQVRRIVEEPAKVYFEQEANTFLERAAYKDVVKFTKRGLEQCPDHAPLKAISGAGAKMVEAKQAQEALDFTKAATLTRAALAMVEKSNRLKIELGQIERTAAFFEKHGSLPGSFMEQRSGKVLVVRHHHPVKAKAWAKAARAEIDRLWRRNRRSRSHKIPSDARLELLIYRSKAEYLAATGDPAKRPYGVLPDTHDARMTYRHRAATYMAVADAQIPGLVARFVADQLYRMSPLWLLEGVVNKGLEKAKPAERAALAELAETKKLMTLDKLLGIRYFGELEDADARKAFIRQARSFVQYLAGWPDGRRTLYKALEKSRAVMSYELRLVITGKRKIKKGMSLKFDDLMPLYVRAVFPSEYRFKTLKSLEASYINWLKTGKRKREPKR